MNIACLRFGLRIVQYSSFTRSNNQIAWVRVLGSFVGHNEN